MARQRRIVAAAQASRTGSEIDVMIDGPSPEHELVLQGRTEGQAPDIDAVVYLTDCDPASYRPGELIRAQIVEARDYDLVAAPVSVLSGNIRIIIAILSAFRGSANVGLRLRARCISCRRAARETSPELAARTHPASEAGTPTRRPALRAGRCSNQPDGYRRPSAEPL